MRYQDQIAKATQKLLDDICRAALAVPDDKHAWSPGGEARSVLSQMQEIALSSGWFSAILRDGKAPEFDGHAAREYARLKQSFDSVQKCVDAAKQSMAELAQLIVRFPDSDLDREVTMPFGGGAVMTMADVLMMPYWNIAYHLGQINYIQLMLGDKEMH